MNTIFGYTWEEIRQAQQGGKLSRTISSSGEKLKATEKDLALLAEHGAEYLYDQQLWGVIDRLGLPLTKPE